MYSLNTRSARERGWGKKAVLSVPKTRLVVFKEADAEERVGEVRDELCYGRIERVVPPASLDEDGSSSSQQRSNNGQVKILPSLSNPTHEKAVRISPVDLNVQDEGEK